MWCCYWASVAGTQKHREAGGKVGRQPAAATVLAGRWVFTHRPVTWRTCALLAQKCKLICQSSWKEGEGWGIRAGGGGEEEEGGKQRRSMLWKVAKYSHRNLTLTCWLQPRSRRFLHLKRRPVLFLGRDLMEEPQREWQEENADSESTLPTTTTAPILPHPVASALPHFDKSTAHAFLAWTGNVAAIKPRRIRQQGGGALQQTFRGIKQPPLSNGILSPPADSHPPLDPSVSNLHPPTSKEESQDRSCDRGHVCWARCPSHGDPEGHTRPRKSELT